MSNSRASRHFDCFNNLVRYWFPYLKPIELQVYLIYLSHMNANTGEAWPGSMSIAKRLGHQKPTKIYPARKRLVELGLLKVLQQGGVQGTNHDPNIYEVLIPSQFIPSQIEEGYPSQIGMETPSQFGEGEHPMEQPSGTEEKSGAEKKGKRSRRKAA